jgi:hypothetical protein
MQERKEKWQLLRSSSTCDEVVTVKDIEIPAGECTSMFMTSVDNLVPGNEYTIFRRKYLKNGNFSIPEKVSGKTLDPPKFELRENEIVISPRYTDAQYEIHASILDRRGNPACVTETLQNTKSFHRKGSWMLSLYAIENETKVYLGSTTVKRHVGKRSFMCPKKFFLSVFIAVTAYIVYTQTTNYMKSVPVIN